MRLTKLGHSCVRLDNGDARLVIDPGVWSGADPLAGASAVLITHEHPDHLDEEVVRAALERDQGLRLWSTAAVAARFSAFGARVRAVGDGDAFTAAGFEIRVHGHDHAVVHRDLPVVRNVGFEVDGRLFHPGDSFTLPGGQVDALLLPVSAPWLKAAEVFDYARAVRPRISYAIHDEIVNANGLRLIENLASALLGTPGEGGYARLAPGESAQV